ncbi:MAG: PAS domain S-box protein [Deltaproteobacteria bacterium]|nr:PAS domain S-box protein [Deltaproteobacteria bacterium]
MKTDESWPFEPALDSQLERVNILVVDDKPDKLKALCSVLEGLGENVVTADSGKEALRLMLRQDFALILLDVHMPVMDGFETASLIRQRPRSERTPIIFITAINATETHASRGYSLGAVDYIFAPVAPEVLRAKVTVFIDLFRKTEQVKRQAEWLRAEAERRATQLENRLDGLLNRLNVGVFRATLLGSLVEANPACLKILGLASIDDARFADLSELQIPREERPLLLKSIALDGRLPDKVVRISRADGLSIWVSVSRTLSVDSTGATCVDGLIEDVTERYKAEAALRESEERFRMMADTAPVLIWLSGADGGRTFCNRPWLDFTGIQEQSTLGEGWLECVHPEDRERCREEISRPRDGTDLHPSGDDGATQCEFRLLRKDGEYRWMLASTVNRFTADGAYAGRLGSSIDISDHRKAQEVLERQARELARSNADLQQFAYVASHDLQQPLRMVASFTDLLARRYRGKLDARADEYIAFAVDGAKRMQALINDLLAYSLLETTRQFEPCDMSSILDDALSDLRVAISECRAEIIRSPLPSVLGERTQLVQVFENLIANAVKFRSEAPPRIDISSTRVGDEWVFSVRDNGIGVDPEFATRAFEIFQRFHDRDRYAGTGIGLAVCKRIVERHAGRIWVESAEGGGSVFRFAIPTREP